MTKNRTPNPLAALFAAGGATTFLVILALLHIIKPENDPSWRMVSEYELGNYGWLMHINFVIWAVAALSLFIALRPHVVGLAGRLGRWLLPVGALGMLLGTLFVTDPGWTEEFTASGRLHNLGGALMMFSTPFLLTLVTFSLSRNTAWQPVKGILWALTALAWVGIAAFIVILMMAGTSTLSPSVMVGWPNRLLVIGYSLWVAMAGLHALRLGRQKSS